MFLILWGTILCYFWYSGGCLTARPAASQTLKNIENPLVSTSRKPYAPFSRNGRNDLISEEFQSENESKTNAQKRPHDTIRNTPKNTIFDAKMAAFWSKKPFQKHHESQERAEVSSGTLKIASAALLESLRGKKKTLVTSKSGLEEFLDRQDGDEYL